MHACACIRFFVYICLYQIICVYMLLFVCVCVSDFLCVYMHFIRKKDTTLISNYKNNCIYVLRKQLIFRMHGVCIYQNDIVCLASGGL